jgi:hypothetical protein
VNTPKNDKSASPTGPENKRGKRTKAKLIRLDDLLPKKDVKGGNQMLFGVTDTNKQQTTQNKQIGK